MFVSKTALQRLIFTAAVLVLVAGPGCSKKTKEDESSVPNAAAADENQMGDSDSGKAMGLQTVHFPYDSSTLDSEGKSVLKGNAEILKSKSSLKIQVEGHCDQRGGIQYNIALGEKRANAAKKYLSDIGVKGERVTVVSFGKEKPIDSAETEEAYAKNRRDNFVVTSR
jgi:peptidoglycan-associated lipoprotein